MCWLGIKCRVGNVLGGKVIDRVGNVLGGKVIDELVMCWVGR